MKKRGMKKYENEEVEKVQKYTETNVLVQNKVQLQLTKHIIL